MTVDRRELLADLLEAQPLGERDAEISVPALVRTWLGDAATRAAAPPRSEIDALCRQIDVRKRLSVRYGSGWATAAPEEPAPEVVVVGAAAVLLATAEAGSAGDGWGLKLVNSALKALDLIAPTPEVPAIRGWAVELLDRATASEPT